MTDKRIAVLGSGANGASNNVLLLGLGLIAAGFFGVTFWK